MNLFREETLIKLLIRPCPHQHPIQWASLQTGLGLHRPSLARHSSSLEKKGKIADAYTWFGHLPRYVPFATSCAVSLK